MAGLLSLARRQRKLGLTRFGWSPGNLAVPV